MKRSLKSTAAHKRKLALSPRNESMQREIARRLKLGLPLTGLLTAALLCGCGEQTAGHLQGVPVPPEETRGTASRTDRPNAGEEQKTDATQAEIERINREIDKLAAKGEKVPSVTMGLYVPGPEEEQSRRLRQSRLREISDEMKRHIEEKEAARKAAAEKDTPSGATSHSDGKNESGGAGK